MRARTSAVMKASPASAGSVRGTSLRIRCAHRSQSSLLPPAWKAARAPAPSPAGRPRSRASSAAAASFSPCQSSRLPCGAWQPSRTFHATARAFPAGASPPASTSCRKPANRRAPASGPTAAQNCAASTGSPPEALSGASEPRRASAGTGATWEGGPQHPAMPPGPGTAHRSGGRRGRGGRGCSSREGDRGRGGCEGTRGPCLLGPPGSALVGGGRWDPLLKGLALNLVEVQGGEGRGEGSADGGPARDTGRERMGRERE